MSLSWLQRKAKLNALLKSRGDEDADGVALDRLLHGQNVIGKTSKTIEIDALRFQDKDLSLVGTLEFGQYGVIDVVNCRLDSRVYVRKSIEKRFALRTRDQCFPCFERDILLKALKTDSQWAPHLLCAFQTPTHLNLVMDYAEGGSLWDVLESSPQNGKLLESDLQWWVPQIVSAIHWCHTQGFAHRDIKPQNFVLTQDAHILLIDFGSAAPLLPPEPDGTQLIPKRYCLVPCGTCDYVSPEILKSHEEALVALEMEDDEVVEHSSRDEGGGYGVETDWWSFGAMLYEMAYGVTPFFANEIRHTYQKIMNHERSLRFDESIPVPSVYKDFISKLLTYPEFRIGRYNIMEIADHPLFEAVNWTNIHEQKAPEGLHLPQFTYNEVPPAHVQPESKYEESLSQGFAFSALFQSSPVVGSSASPSILRPTPTKSALQETPSAAFIGFSWGPTSDAFPPPPTSLSPSMQAYIPSTPQPPSLAIPPHFSTPKPSPGNNLLTTPLQRFNTFSTPNRPYAFTPFRTNTLPRTGNNRGSVQRRDMSDREAMKQLVDCVGMSARKKVLESGRKPQILTNSSSLRGGYGTLRKELRFMADPIPMPDYGSFSQSSSSLSTSNLSYRQQDNHGNQAAEPKLTYTQKAGRLAPITIDTGGYSGSEADITDSEGPPSPSPRPGSALSISRRSATPTMTMTMMTGSSLSMRSMMTPTTATMSSMILTRRSSSSSLLVPLTARSASFPVPVQGVQVGGNLSGEKEKEKDKRQGYAEGRNLAEQGGRNVAGPSGERTKIEGAGERPRVRTERERMGGRAEPGLMGRTRDRSEDRRAVTAIAESQGINPFEKLERRLDLLVGEIEGIEGRLTELKLTITG